MQKIIDLNTAELAVKKHTYQLISKTNIKCALKNYGPRSFGVLWATEKNRFKTSMKKAFCTRSYKTD